VIATTSSHEKAQRLTELGAYAVINYVQTPEWSSAVLDLTDGRGVDRVVEVGGSGTIAQSIKSVTYHGEIALVGMLDPTPEGMNLIDFFLSQSTLRTIGIGSRADLEDMNRALSAHDVHPIIDRVFPFEDARKAFRHLAGGQHFGKVVIAH
jgi:NADPH:quinone reductase-like Zn-dependent oxidoreductase